MAALPFNRGLGREERKNTPKVHSKQLNEDLRCNKSHVMVNLPFSTDLAQAILELMVVKPTEQTEANTETFFGWSFF